MVDIDTQWLEQFERGLDPARPDQSDVPARLIGYGEISAIFVISGREDVAFKRMPLFHDRDGALAYGAMYRDYCHLLAQAGLRLPDSDVAVVEVPDRPVVLYIAQARLPEDSLCHHRVRHLSPEPAVDLVQRVVREIMKVRAHNADIAPETEIAVDGQVSNWALSDPDDPEAPLVYLDTSTPFIRRKGRHELDPELILQAAPVFLRWLVRWLFVDDVMNRYYDLRLNCIDLAANLYKEQREDLVAPVVDRINAVTDGTMAPIRLSDVVSYYREDKMIWRLFLALRRLDRWITTSLMGKRYEFILPGPIRR